MVRGAKIPMEFIKDRKPRLNTFLTRRKGLEKKTHELSTLCGVQVGLIIFAPQDITSTKINNKEPLLYPQDPEEINNIIHSFLTSDPIERKRRSTDLSGFYLDQTNKARDELIKLKKDNIESLYPTWDHTYNNLSAGQLRSFQDQLEFNIQDAKARLDSIKRSRLSSLIGGYGSNMNVYEAGKLTLSGNDDQLRTWPVPAMLGWNSIQADVIQPQEISHQGTGLCFPPFQNAMADSPRPILWTREDASSSSANIMFNMDFETKARYNSSSTSNPLLHMDMESKVGRHSMTTSGFLENQHDYCFLLPSTGTTQWHSPPDLESEVGKNNMIAGFLENTDTGILENQHDNYLLLPPMETMQ